MPRPKSDEKRSALLDATTRMIVAQGLGAPTAVIAREAGIANGSLFTYFETKAELFSQLYLELKVEATSAALEGLPTKADVRDQFLYVWSNWTRWAVRNPDKRRALTLLGVSDDITPASRAAGSQVMAGIAALIQQARADGPLRDAPFPFVAAMMNALAEATMDYMVQDPANADEHCRVGFEAMWRMFS